jgi:hypothetical protein
VNHMGEIEAHHLTGSDALVQVGQVQHFVRVPHARHIGGVGLHVPTAVRLPLVVRVGLAGVGDRRCGVGHSSV